MAESLFFLFARSVIISLLRFAMKYLLQLAVVAVLLPGLIAPASSASSGDLDAPAAVVSPPSADDFDWRQMLPYLYVAAQLPGEQGIKELLENFSVLREYVAGEPAPCRAGSPCPAPDRASLSPSEVTRRIDQIVQEQTLHQQKITRLDYLLSRTPYPFIAIAAVKSTHRQDACLVLDFAEHSYTSAQVRQRYGEPYDTDVLLWFGVYKYRLDTDRYSARVAFTIDPTDGEIRRIAITLQRRNDHKRGPSRHSLRTGPSSPKRHSESHRLAPNDQQQSASAPDGAGFRPHASPHLHCLERCMGVQTLQENACPNSGMLDTSLLTRYLGWERISARACASSPAEGWRARLSAEA